MRVALLLVAALSSSGMVACAVPAPDSRPDSTSDGTKEAARDPASSTATAVIAVERSTGPGDAVRGDAVTARFVRVRQGSVDDPALRIAGIVTDIPSLGTCSVPADSTPAIQGRSVELLDVGSLQVLSSGPVSSSGGTALDPAAKSTMLFPRLMPDPAAMVSGVFYASPRSADVFVAGSRVSLRSPGGPDLAEGFSIAANTPRDVTDVKVSAAASGLDVSWDATDTDAHDIVYVDVLSPAPRVILRCAGADTGHLSLASSSLPEDGQLAVHRLHRESFRAKGIDPGEVRFDVARIVSFHR